MRTPRAPRDDLGRTSVDATVVALAIVLALAFLVWVVRVGTGQ